MLNNDIRDKYLKTLKTENDYLRAVVEFGFGLDIVPDDIKTNEFIAKVIKDPEAIIDLNQIPKEMVTYELCLRVVNYYGFDLRDVPMEYRDFDLCLAAVKNEHQAFVSVPQAQKDKVFEAFYGVKIPKF